MRKMIFLAATGLAACLFGLSPAAAKPKLKIPAGTSITRCEFDVSKHEKTVPPDLVILREKSGRVLAYDGLVMMFNNDQPVEARVHTENDKRVTYAWDLEKAHVRGQAYASKIMVRLTITKADNKASIQVMPLGYLTEGARGRCRPE